MKKKIILPLIAAANDAAKGDGLPSTVLIEMTAAISITAPHLMTECSRICTLFFVTALDIVYFLSQMQIFPMKNEKSGNIDMLLFYN